MNNDDKVYYPSTIPDEPFPSQTVAENFGSSSPASPQNTYAPSKIADQSVPTKRIAVEVIGQALNTRSKKILQEFQFTPSGALQIGKYENGVSGDVRVSPIGIVMRDAAGTITVALYAEDGSGVFKGSIQAGSLITGAVAVGNGDILIDGETRRMIFYDNGVPVIVIGNA